jgi:hypothetical protein
LIIEPSDHRIINEEMKRTSAGDEDHCTNCAAVINKLLDGSVLGVFNQPWPKKKVSRISGKSCYYARPAKENIFFDSAKTASPCGIR